VCFNAEGVGEHGERFANTFGVTNCLLIFLTQGCANPGLALANAFGVYRNSPSNRKPKKQLTAP